MRWSNRNTTGYCRCNWRHSAAPLDATAFYTLVKTADEVRRRHELHFTRSLHEQGVVVSSGSTVPVTLDIVTHEDPPYAVLTACVAGERDAPPLTQVRVAAAFKLTEASFIAWIEDGFRRPEG